MGYRSQVVLAISKELIPFLMLATSKCKETEELVFKYGNLERNYENDKSWLLVWDSIKWYEGFSDIDAIEKFMDDAESGDWVITNDDGQDVHSEELFRFVRVGEEHGDVDVRGSGYWDITPVTSIQY